MPPTIFLTTQARNVRIFFFFFNLNLFVYFNWQIIASQYCDGFLPYINMNLHRYTCVPSIVNPPSHFPPNPVPPGSSLMQPPLDCNLFVATCIQ